MFEIFGTSFRHTTRKIRKHINNTRFLQHFAANCIQIGWKYSFDRFLISQNYTERRDPERIYNVKLLEISGISNVKPSCLPYIYDNVRVPLQSEKFKKKIFWIVFNLIYQIWYENPYNQEESLVKNFNYYEIPCQSYSFCTGFNWVLKFMIIKDLEWYLIFLAEFHRFWKLRHAQKDSLISFFI